MASSPVALANGGGGLSSPTTPPPPSTFRELDDAFLQNQTRIWLGVVLNMKFDKDTDMSDLLADGQILFEVYKLFRHMLLSEDIPSNQRFLERESVSSSEITEKYPYVKVERFLEVCKRLGLSDIDLFTTADVVHKGNTRKVCMCLRSLSKRAISRNLHIPDFDSVTHRKKSPVSMPTDMVGNRRRNLEHSASSSVLGSDDLSKDSRRSQQGESSGLHASTISYKSGDDEDGCNSESIVGDSMEHTSANSTSPRTPDPSTVSDFSFVQSELEQRNITSPTQSLGSGVGDNFQLIDHHSDHGHGNNPNPIHADWQSSSDEESGDNETESSGDDAENAADLLHSSDVENEVFGINENEPYCSLRDLCNVIEKPEIEDLKNENKMAQPSTPPSKMLKLIAGGTGTVAAMGVLLFWLQLRKKGTKNAASPNLSLPNPARISTTDKNGKPDRAATTNKIYPTNRLSF